MATRAIVLDSCLVVTCLAGRACLYGSTLSSFHQTLGLDANCVGPFRERPQPTAWVRTQQERMLTVEAGTTDMRQGGRQGWRNRTSADI
jgi:hypothetical protein